MKRDGVGIGLCVGDVMACFPLEVFVNFGEFPESLELSEGRFRLCRKETKELAWIRLGVDLDNGEGEGD